MLLDLIFVWCIINVMRSHSHSHKHSFLSMNSKKKMKRRRSGKWIMNQMRILLLMSYFQLYWSLAIQWRTNKERKSDAKWINVGQTRWLDSPLSCNSHHHRRRHHYSNVANENEMETFCIKCASAIAISLDVKIKVITHIHTQREGDIALR